MRYDWLSPWFSVFFSCSFKITRNLRHKTRSLLPLQWVHSIEFWSRTIYPLPLSSYDGGAVAIWLSNLSKPLMPSSSNSSNSERKLCQRASKWKGRTRLVVPPRSPVIKLGVFKHGARQGFMPCDKQAVPERALKLGRVTQAVIGASSGQISSFPKSIVFFRNFCCDGLK